MFGYAKATYQLFQSWLTLEVEDDGLHSAGLFMDAQVAYESNLVFERSSAFTRHKRIDVYKIPMIWLSEVCNVCKLTVSE